MIIGFPHCGTSILRCIIGRCSNIEEQYEEEYAHLLNNKYTNKEFYLTKIPFAKKEFFSKNYDKFIKIFIIRNPVFSISSINKRFENICSIPENHTIDSYINTLELFIDCKNNNYKNTYTIRYEDLFMNNNHNLKKILDEIGLKYNNDIFTTNSDVVWGWPKESIPIEMPDNTDHSNYRVWQNSQPFILNNNLSTIYLINTQKEQILKSNIIKYIYPEVDDLLSNEKIIIPFGEECYTAQSIDSKFSKNTFRKYAFPFDYVGHTYIESIYDNLFDLLNSNNFICNNNDFCLEIFNDKYFMCHKKYGFKYWHDIQFHDNKIINDDEINSFIGKYNRRYERLKYYLKNNNKIIIFSVNHFDNIFYKKTVNKQNTIYKLFNLLKSHNNDIQFIVVNFGEDLYNLKNLQFVNLPVNYNLSFTESKQEFTEQLHLFIKSEF
jgi:hypothetical protein